MRISAACRSLRTRRQALISLRTLMLAIALSFADGFETASAQQLEMKIHAGNPNMPYWVKLMYGDNPDPEKVTEEFEKYYESHPFEKNEYTQYYKRWIREIWRS